MKKLLVLLMFSTVIFLLSCNKEGPLEGSPTDSLASSEADGFSTAADFSGSASSSSSSSSSGASGTSGNNNQADWPGVITAGEWVDVENWDFWQDLLNHKDYSDKATYWDMQTLPGISITIKNLAQVPIIDAKVSLDYNGQSLWEAKTDNQGKAVLFPMLFERINNFDFSNLSLSINDGVQTISEVKTIEQGGNQIIMPGNNTSNNQAEIAFVVDATSSMSDELEYLKTELKDVIRRAEADNPTIPIATSSVFYRDQGDDYVTRKSAFSDEIQETLNFINKQAAGGGGDYPEAVHSALEVALDEFNWATSAKSRIIFLVLDAPPHHEISVIESMQTALKKAAKMGIKIIPITASGINKETEFLMRFSAIATNGSYVFITDHSGIGNEHLEPTVGEYEVEFLNDLMVRLINENLE